MCHPSEEEYGPPRPTPRHRAALALAAYLERGGFRCPRPEHSRGGKCYIVAWERGGERGVVQVYGPDYLRVDGHRLSRVFGSWEEAAAAMVLLYVRGDADASEEVPDRPARRRGKAG